jgi:DNA gyrase subunit B
MTEQSYGANDMNVLEGLEAVRKRPGMYIGSTDSRGVLHLTAEILDNATDEAVGGHASRIEVTLHPDGSVEVTDNGRGIPTGINTKAGMSGVKMALSLLHAGGKFSSKNYNSSGGLHGVGSSAVNALSHRMDATVKQNGQVHQISFQHGVSGTFAGPGPKDKFTPGGDLKVTGKMKRGESSGTSIRYWHDERYFEKDAVLEVDELRKKMRNAAFLVPNATYVLRNATAGAVEVEEFHFPQGIVDMVDFLTPSSDKPLCDTIVVNGTGTYKENAPDENGVMQEGVVKTLEVEIAFRWGTGYDTTIQCFTNTIPNRDGGTHKSGFESALKRTLGEAIKSARGLLKAKDEAPILDDMLEGMTAVIHVKAPEPKFTSQTKDRLSTSGITKATQTLVEQSLKAWVDGRKTKTEARVVLGKIVDASRVRLTQKQQKETARRKTALEGASMPAKLVDCRANGVERSELFIVEGDSALGSARKGRSSEYQALLPIRGKILNVQKASLSDALKNLEVASIIQVLGAGSGRSFDIEQMRYGRIMLMADADSDGSHIRCLLITLFYKYMRPVIEEGRLYAAMPPLFKVTTKGRNPEVHHVSTQVELDRLLAKLEKAGKDWVTPIPRFKGLGEMNAEQLWETTMDPSRRSVRRITIEDAEQAEFLLNLAMGSDVGPRRDWIIDSADKVDKEAIDA